MEMPDRMGERFAASVIVPCRNAGRTLGTTLESVAAQTLPAHEVLVVDDASEDDTAAVARRHGATVLRNERRRNAGGSRNRGIEAATGTVLAFLDADVEVSPNWLERVRADFDAMPEVVGVGGRIANGRPGLYGDLDFYLNHSEWIHGPARPAGTFPTMAVAYRRRSVAEVRFPETNLGEDTLFARAVLARGGTLWFDPEILIIHRHERLDWDAFWWKSRQAGQTWYWARVLADRPGRILVRHPALLWLFPHLWIVLGRMVRSGQAPRALRLLPWFVAGEIGRNVGFLTARRQHRHGRVPS